MNNKRGKFIVIEGIDGSGKTTQIKMLKKKFKNNFHFTREASDGPIGKLLRKLYLTGKRKCDERIINMLYAADRLDHITNSQDGILNTIENGTNVISDRYYLSSMAYNTYTAENNYRLHSMILNTIDMNKIAFNKLRPDLTIYIDVEPKIAIKRMSRRFKKSSVYETEDKLNKIRDAYSMANRILTTKYGEKIVIVNGNSSDPNKINDFICTLINDELRK